MTEGAQIIRQRTEYSRHDNMSSWVEIDTYILGSRWTHLFRRCRHSVPIPISDLERVPGPVANRYKFAMKSGDFLPDLLRSVTGKCVMSVRVQRSDVKCVAMFTEEKDAIMFKMAGRFETDC